MKISAVKYLNRFLYLLLVGIFLLWGAISLAQPVSTKAIKGCLDLRQKNIEKESFTLSGEWYMYWEKFIYPDDSLPSSGHYVSFPMLWSDIVLDGKNLPSSGYATYYLTVLLPKYENRLALQLPEVYSAYRLYVNGNLLAVNGHPAETAAENVPAWVPKTIELNVLSDTMRIFLQISNFEHTRGGTYKEIVIGDRDQLFHERERLNVFDFFITGCLFMGGLFFLGLYLFGRHDRAILFFSLFCIAYSYRIVGAEFYSLHTVFTHIPWSITLHLEYLALYCSVGFFALYMESLYTEDAYKPATYVIVGFCIFFSVCCLLLPTLSFTYLNKIFLVNVFVFISYGLYVHIKATKNHRVGAKYSLLGSVLILLVFSVTIFDYLVKISTSRIWMFAGYIVFFFIQSLILSFRFAFTLKQAKLQAEEGLKAKGDFISTMSHEIRTPLNSVIGMTHLMLKNEPRNDQKEQLNIL